MKNTFAALAILAFSVQAFAADKGEIVLPGLSALPFKVSTPFTPDDDEARVFGRINGWGKLSNDTGTFTELEDQNTKLLASQKCAINFAAGQTDTGRIVQKGPVAAIACYMNDGTLIAVDVQGFLVDSAGEQGLAEAKYGDEAFFVLEKQVRIPLTFQ